jgi:hypothetical protein
VGLKYFFLFWTFIFFYFSGLSIFSNQVALLADNPGHFYNFFVFVNESLPHFRLVTWNPSHLMGEPLMLHYYPLPFVVMGFLNLFLPIEMAFNIGSWLPLYLFPFCFLFAVKSHSQHKLNLFSYIVVLVVSVIFIFNKEYTLLGGNGLSVMVGLFCQSYGILFFLICYGFALRVNKNKINIYWAAFFASMTCLSHSHVFLQLMILISVVLLIQKHNSLFDRLKNLLRFCVVTFLFSAFYLVPMLEHRSWMTVNPHKLNLESVKSVFELFQSLPFVMIMVALIVFKLASKNFKLTIHTKAVLVATALLMLMCYIYPVLGVDANRALPQIILLILLMVAIELSTLNLKSKTDWKLIVAVISVLSGAFFWFKSESRQLQYWSYLNFSKSSENYAKTKEIDEVFSIIKGNFSDPRVFVENSDDLRENDNFYLLPLKSGRSMLTGLYIDAVPSAKLITSFQNQISSSAFCPWDKFNCLGMLQHANDNGLWLESQMNRFAVDTLLLRSDRSIKQAEKIPSLINKYQSKNFSIFKLNSNISLVEQVLSVNQASLKSRPCVPEIKVSYHQIDLLNLCEGVETLIKFNYFPNLISDSGDVLNKNSDGFISVVPSKSSMMISWKSSALAKISYLLSAISFLGFVMFLLKKVF